MWITLCVASLSVIAISAEKWSTIPKLWPNAVIPYKLARHVKFSDDKAEFQSALDEIQNQTCIKFIPRKDETDFVLISAGLSCNSPIGRQGGEEVISLQIPFCLERKKILRQLLRVLGMPNEQLRPDRDDYIHINMENVNNWDAPLFTMINATDLPLPWSEMPYDYGSIMHAESNFKAVNASIPTIIPLETDAVLGKATGLSSLDVMKLNMLYC